MAKTAPHPLLTPELSKAARRELSLTQNNVIAETGIQAYKLKQFEAGRFRPEMACLKQLREFYESHGIDIGQLEAHTSGSDEDDPESDVRIGQRLPRQGITPTPRPGFFITEHLSQDLVDRVLDRMEENDDRISELIQGTYETGLFGSVTEATDTNVRELFASMAESHLMFRFLQGKNIIAPIREEPKTIGEFLAQWLQQSSPVYAVLDAGESEG